MLINEAIDPEALDAAPRALIHLTVEWSAPERVARRAFVEAVRLLSTEHADLNVDFFMVDEEAEAFRGFLAEHGYRTPTGSGGLIWLEAGRRVDSCVAGHTLGSAGIVNRTLALWGEEAG